ncbi:MAG: type II secretion system F family protein [Candidatus Eisenbacteria bacterium]|uniref:Type II secretion system F family protein n=1 Tax=Eiseniibacteriota bacterium TaxID=2212470 RepID=A0A538T575_UNCEI|nr:MAG: type II secretion system F family protein [Candidatus Eisenbacteria bacterium]TMQ58796.1 MAG: type II secretion system F family protein [Candidatus Eisenbacteria bacterium]
MLLLATILFAVAFGTGLLAVYQILVRDRDPVVARLRDLRARTVAARPEVKKERAWTLADALATLGGFLPTRESDESLRSGLERAGIRAPRAELVFLGTKVFLAFTSGLAWVTISYALARPMGSILLQGGIAVVVGFYFPTFWLYRKGEARKAQIQAALADTLDLLVVCVEAGLALNAAIERVGREVELSSPALSDELLLANQEIQTGLARSEALRRLARRTGVEDIYALTAMLIQAEKLGASIAQSLRAHAESMRTKRRQRAEQAARKAGIKLAFPLVFMIFPALLIVILGPAAIQLMQALAAQSTH